MTIVCGINPVVGVVHWRGTFGAVNREKFLEFMESLLNSEARGQLEERLIIILDNVSFHRTGEVAEFVNESGNELVFLPRYSPFLNPIEHTFSTWKSHVRRPVAVPQGPNFGMRARQELLRVVEEAGGRITPEMCTNWFRHCGGYLQRCLLREDILW